MVKHIEESLNLYKCLTLKVYHSVLESQAKFVKCTCMTLKQVRKNKEHHHAVLYIK